MDPWTWVSNSSSNLLGVRWEGPIQFWFHEVALNPFGILLPTIFVHRSDSGGPIAGLLLGIFHICQPVEQPALRWFLILTEIWNMYVSQLFLIYVSHKNAQLWVSDCVNAYYFFNPNTRVVAKHFQTCQTIGWSQLGRLNCRSMDYSK